MKSVPRQTDSGASQEKNFQDSARASSDPAQSRRQVSPLVALQLACRSADSGGAAAGVSLTLAATLSRIVMLKRGSPS